METGQQIDERLYALLKQNVTLNVKLANALSVAMEFLPAHARVRVADALKSDEKQPIQLQPQLPVDCI